MDSLAKIIISLLFLILTGVFTFFLINFGMSENSEYGTMVLTTVIFLVVILGIVGISYFARRGKTKTD